MRWRILLAIVPLLAAACGACAARKDAPVPRCTEPGTAEVGAVQRYVGGLAAGNLVVAFNQMVPRYQRAHMPDDLALPGLRALQVTRLCLDGMSQGPAPGRDYLRATLQASFAGDPPAGWHQGSNSRGFLVEFSDSGVAALIGPPDAMAGG